MSIALAGCGGGGGGDPMVVPVQLRVTDASVTEGNSGALSRALAVSLSAPSSQAVTVAYTTANGTGTAGSDYSATSGTLTFAADQTTAVIYVPIIGDTVDEANETVMVDLSNPANAELPDDQFVVTILDDDGIVTPGVSITDSTVAEGNAGSAVVTLTVSLSQASTQTVSVGFATANGTASAGSDYTGASGTLTFTAGQTSRQVSITVSGDSVDETDETVLVNLSSPVNATIVDFQGVLTIQDDDGSALPAISIADTSVTEGNAGTATALVTVSLSTTSSQAVTVAYSTANGTASAGSDYASASSTVTFNAGQTTRQISIGITGDATDESDETILVNLASPSNATIQDSQALLTILDDDSSFGLDSRPANPDCVAPSRGTGGGPTGVAAEDAFPAAPAFSSPTKILQAPGDPSRWFVLEQAGRIRVFSTSNPGSVSTYLDLTGRVNEANSGGLLSLAFHPNFPSTPEIFVSYTGTGSAQESRISRFTLNNTTTPSLASSPEQVLLTAEQTTGTHKGGDIAFGPDGNLYISIGDSSENNDPNNRGQNTTRLAGKMLRINVLGTGSAYTIPAGNPFAGNGQCGPAANGASCPEIYAWGFRNPWRWSFDPQTGDLWLGDVGEKSREEIDVVELGGNYGWSCREGTTTFNSARCSGGPFTDPAYQYVYGSGGSQSVTGGAVYRGTDNPSLAGRYVFADFGSGRIWALQGSPGSYTAEELLDTPYGVVAFGRGADGELYFVDYNAGRIYRLAPTGGGGGTTDPVPDDLADTGCVNAANPTQPSGGLIPYAINAPFWSDGAAKNRYIGLPPGGTISRNGGDWTFPTGTVLMKTFQLGGQLIETRLFMLHPDGEWAGYTYEWNAAQTAATRVRGGKTKVIGGQTWVYPSESQCLTCHTAAAGFSLGLETRQLNRTQFYPTTGRTSDQLHTLDHIGMFDQPLPGTVTQVIADPSDTSQPLDDRARAYLHTNCAACHRPGGPTTSSMDLLVTTALASTNTCDVVPATTTLGIPNARLVAPGDASRSVLIGRMGRRDADGMPPLGSTVVDAAGEALLMSWADSLTGCQ